MQSSATAPCVATSCIHAVVGKANSRLASKILATVSRQLPNDWQQRYGYRPVLLETFVETPRHRGTCYKAANWVNVGQTTGRGKKGPNQKAFLLIEDIWLYPLVKNFRAVLGA